jgi:UDP-3-O-[3-hydroxymyristoyl] N-acetylglucosamine deacetylase/3-hydroxyacyl-[acyl-carrier-protein] dehydratase
MTRQKTLKSSVVIEGKGLQTGVKTKLVLKSAPACSGVTFIRADVPERPSVNTLSLAPDARSGTRRRTVLRAGRHEVHTTEHLLAALFALGVDNAEAELYGAEPPALDGSALGYVEAIERAGLAEETAEREELRVASPIAVSSDRGSSIAACPCEGLRISYFLSYAVKSIAEQFLSVEISADTFKREIAPARTFCTLKEAVLLKILGFGRGADTKNTLVMGARGPVSNALRFPDEPVRHKILDLIGDLSLTGRAVKAHIIALKSGHALNIELVKKLRAAGRP